MNVSCNQTPVVTMQSVPISLAHMNVHVNQDSGILVIMAEFVKVRNHFPVKMGLSFSPKSVFVCVCVCVCVCFVLFCFFVSFFVCFKSGTFDSYFCMNDRLCNHVGLIFFQISMNVF